MKLKFKLPHSLALLFFLLISAYILSWILPQGVFERTTTDTGRQIVVPVHPPFHV